MALKAYTYSDAWNHYDDENTSHYNENTLCPYFRLVLHGKSIHNRWYTFWQAQCIWLILCGCYILPAYTYLVNLIRCVRVS